MNSIYFTQIGANITVIVQATLPIDDNHTNLIGENDAKMSLTILMRPDLSVLDYCSNLANVCFWDSVVYKVAENSIEWNQTVGPIGPNIYRDLCPDIDVQYELLNGKRCPQRILQNIDDKLSFSNKFLQYSP